MKKQFIEFLSKRLKGKIEDVRNVGTDEEVELLLDDIETYGEQILDIAKEMLMP
jgi:hypothetical protein